MKRSEKSIIDRFDEAMRQLARGFHASDAGCLDGFDLTIQQFVVLQIVNHCCAPKMTDLAAELHVTLGNVTALVDRLIKLKYLRRQADSVDRRIVRVAFTAQGRALVKRAAAKKRKALDLILGHLSAADKKRLLLIMEKLAAAINQKGEVGK